MARNKRRRALNRNKRHEVRSVLRTIGQEANKRGRASEDHVRALLKQLHAEEKIADVIEVARHTWTDFILHTDCVVRRLDGKLVPIQIKSSLSGVNKFIERHAKSCKEKFGALPILVHAPAYGFSDLEEIKQQILHKIESWQGKFHLEMWMLVPSQLLNMDACRHLGQDIGRRIHLFKKQYDKFINSFSPPS